MTAQEARKLANRITNESEKAELKALEDKIRASAENGNLTTGTAGSISAAVQIELQKRGFKIQVLNDRDGNWTTISW